MRYYFDRRLDDELVWTKDPDGTDLDGPDDAQAAALQLLTDMTRDHVGECWQIAVMVRDDQPAPVLRLDFIKRPWARS